MPGMVDIRFSGVAADRAKVLCIVVHGRNQTPEDMEAAVVGQLSTPDVAFVLPRAGDKTWYRALAVEPRAPATEADLGQSLADLGALLARMRAEAAGRPLVLAGFSQGACLSIEQAFTGKVSPDALVAFTGCRVGVPGDTRPMALADDLPVYLTGGQADPWIPVQAFAEAAADLGRSGARLRADLFPGRPHTISAPEIAMLDAILTDLAAGRAPAMGASR